MTAVAEPPSPPLRLDDSTMPWGDRVHQLEADNEQLAGRLADALARVAQLEAEIEDARTAVQAAAAVIGPYLGRLRGGEYDVWAPTVVDGPGVTPTP